MDKESGVGMINLLGVALAVALVAYLEVPALLRDGAHRDVATVGVVLLLGAAGFALLAFQLEVPTVSQVLQMLVGPLVPLR